MPTAEPSNYDYNVISTFDSDVSMVVDWTSNNMDTNHIEGNNANSSAVTKNNSSIVLNTNNNKHATGSISTFLCSDLLNEHAA